MYVFLTKLSGLFLVPSHHVSKQLNILLVSGFEVTSVMAFVVKQQSHVNITHQHSITHIHFLGGWLPLHGLPLHNWTICREIDTIKSDAIHKLVANHPDETEVIHTQ